MFIWDEMNAPNYFRPKRITIRLLIFIYYSVSLSGGLTILHIAAIHNQAECCKYIVATFPELLNGTTADGSTPLHCAAKHGSLESLVILLDAGSDASIRNTFGATPMDLAKAYNHDACVHELEKR